MRSRGFVCVTAADFIVRAAYQMGKTPLLPIFAAALGAGDALLGFIVSVSTLTGMVLKPFVGILSDRWGQRIWLIAGTVFFTGMPFLYRFVDTPEQLVAIRIVHGAATAIYGPATLAYVAGLSRSNRAERIGAFAVARNAGYVVGPLAAGWMLLTMDPVTVFTAIGLLSSAAFVPVLLLPQTGAAPPGSRMPVIRQALDALRSGGRVPVVWVAGALDANINVALYAAKAFVPLYALSIGVNVALAGAFFSVQAAVTLVASPIGGRLSDRFGHTQTAGAGMALLGVALPLLTFAQTWAGLVAPAVLFGAAQALVFPSTMALVSSKVEGRHLGAGMGLVGSLRNAGKVAGPALAGALIHWLDFTYTFRLLGALLLVAAAALWYSAQLSRKPGPEESSLQAQGFEAKPRLRDQAQP